MTSTVVVTGAQGFIGRYMTCELLHANPQAIVGVGRSPILQNSFTHKVLRNGTEQPALLTSELLEAAEHPRYFYRQADITDLHSMARVIAEFEPGIIIHLAAARREEAVERLIHVNVQSIGSLVDACRASGICVKRIVLGSSGAVYGVPAELPLRESSLCSPADAYAASKLAGEHFARVLCDRTDIELLIGRIFNVVGPGQEERHVCGRLASQLAAIAQEEQPPVIFVTALSATRDYVDVRDVASALSLLAEDGHPGEIYNIASGVETSVSKIVEILSGLAGLSGRIRTEYPPDASTVIARHFANIEKLTAEGFRREFNLSASLEGVLCYYLGSASRGCRYRASQPERKE